MTLFYVALAMMTWSTRTENFAVYAALGFPRCVRSRANGDLGIRVLVCAGLALRERQLTGISQVGWSRGTPCCRKHRAMSLLNICSFARCLCHVLSLVFRCVPLAAPLACPSSHCLVLSCRNLKDVSMRTPQTACQTRAHPPS